LKWQAVIAQNKKRHLMFFTKGEPERLRNCVIQPLKYRLLQAFDNTGDGASSTFAQLGFYNQFLALGLVMG